MEGWEESFDNDSMGGNLMGIEYFETSSIIPEPLFCGVPMEEVNECMLHEMIPRKCVAFEGASTGRRFYGCPVHGGVNCAVVKWVDPARPDILKNCLIKLWEMFHEQNVGRIHG
ncbi:hypothetical protein VPH35_044572 [Triticum aestivum]